MSKLSNKLSMNFAAEFGLSEFSFSQLIVAVKKLFDTEGIPGFVKALIILIDNLLIKSGTECPHCQSTKAHHHGVVNRKLKTSIGEVNLVLNRLKCSGCKRTYVPMTKLFDLNQYSRKSREFEKLGLETETNQSFRRSAKNLFSFIFHKTQH